MEPNLLISKSFAKIMQKSDLAKRNEIYFCSSAFVEMFYMKYKRKYNVADPFFI